MSFKKVELHDLVDDDRGISYGVVQPGEHVLGGVPIVRVNNLRGNQMNYDEVLTISPDIASKYLRTRLSGGEVLISLVGTVGRCIVAPRELKGWNVARAIGVIPLKKEIDARWVLYALQDANSINFINERLNTTVQATLNLKDVAKIRVPFPDKLYQDRIVEILSCLDDKIELNNRINKNLEEMAQAIFKSWFVDFDPFQNGEFIDSHLGRIPKGWKVGTLGDVITMSYGKALTAQNRIDGPFPVYSSAGCTGYHNQPLMNERGIVVGRKGTIGTVYYSSVPFFCIDTAYYIPESGASLGLQNTYHLLSYLGLTKYNEDSAVPGLNRNTVYSIRIVIPPVNVSQKTEEILEALSVQIEHRKKENMKLQTIRDALLPKLMSGEIRVPIEEA